MPLKDRSPEEHAWEFRETAIEYFSKSGGEPDIKVRGGTVSLNYKLPIMVGFERIYDGKVSLKVGSNGSSLDDDFSLCDFGDESSSYEERYILILDYLIKGDYKN